MRNHNKIINYQKLFSSYILSAWALIWLLLTTGIITSLVIVAKNLGAGENCIQILARIWAHILANIVGCRLSVSGLNNIKPKATYIFASNHTSALDILALLAMLPTNFRWIAKKELFNIPIFGSSLRAAGYIAINRNNKQAAKRSIIETAERIKIGNNSIVIFPEGTRSINGKLLPFKSGSFILAKLSDRPIVPVAISGAHCALPAKKLLITPTSIHVKIGHPVELKKIKNLDRYQLANLTQSKILTLLSQNNCFSR